MQMRMTAKRAAKTLLVSRSTLYRLHKEGKIRATKKGQHLVFRVNLCDRIMTVKSLSDSACCSRRYINKLIESGRVDAFRVGSQWRIPWGEAEKVMNIRFRIPSKEVAS